MITPQFYFAELKRIGFRFKVENHVRGVKDYWGSMRRRTVSRYIACKNVNGHLISIRGDVHVVDEDVCVSAITYFTSSLSDAINPLVEIPTFTAITTDEFAEILRWVRIAGSLGPCTDYEIVNGGKI